MRRPEGNGGRAVEPDADGWAPLRSLGVGMRLGDGRLQVRTDVGIEEM